jgi:hypothetical protein
VCPFVYSVKVCPVFSHIFSLIGKVSAFEAASYWFKSIKVLKFLFLFIITVVITLAALAALAALASASDFFIITFASPFPFL